MNKRLKGLISRLLIIVMFVGSLASLQTGVGAVGGDNVGAGLESPVIGAINPTGTEVTFNYQGDGSEQKVEVKGSFYKNWGETIPLIKGNDNVWSLTIEVEPGSYKYGLEVNGVWKGDPLNTPANGDPPLLVPGVSLNSPKVILLGNTSVIDAVYYAETGDNSPTPEDFTYTLNTNGLSGIQFDGVTRSLSVDEDADTGNIEIEARYGNWSAVRTIQITSVKSPVINNDGTVTFNVLNDNYSSLYIVGEMNGWNNAADGSELTLNNGVFSITLPLKTGAHEYQFLPTKGSWNGQFADPLNPQRKGDNSQVTVPGIDLSSNPNSAKTGTSVQLKAKYFQTGIGTSTDISSPTWSLDSSLTGVTLSTSGLLTVASDAAVGKVTVKASYQGYEATKEINIVDTVYSYTINYYRYDGNAKDWNLWLWPDGADGTGNAFSSELNGIAKGTYEYTESSINAIARLSKNGNDWASEEPKVKINIPEGQESVEVWLVEGVSKVFYQKPDFDAIKPVMRSIQFTYVSNETELSELKKWNIWTWSTGKSDGENLFTKFDGNKATAIIPIGNTVGKIGFKMRKGNWEQRDQDYDREIITGSEAVTKVIVTAGQGAFRTLPFTSAPVLEDGKATFTYRDEALYESNEMDKINEVLLNINGQLHKMNYVAEDERFVYTLNLLTEGTIEYTYVVKYKEGLEKEISDPKNTKDGKSVIEYKKIDLTIGTSVSPSSISYNENAVLKLTLSDDEGAEIKTAYADMTSLGGGNKEVIDVSLLERTISVKDSVTAGNKTIKVTLIDEFGNVHKANAEVTVKPRVSTGTLDDFDWDEARIYFMLTDRFRNGDTSNDDPNVLNTKHPDHLEAYHGGDIKGITEKLEYLDELGINTIWITPIVDNIDYDNRWTDPNNVQFGYHGYWAKNFEKMDEHLGDVEDLQELIDKAHDRGIKIMVDVVLNHTGYGLKASDESNGAGIPGYPTTEDRDRFKEMLRVGGSGDITGELAGLPDFLTEDPKVRDQVIQWQVDWLEKARTDRGDTIDYFRVDTIKHVESTTLVAFKNELTKAEPDFKLIGENFGGTLENTGGYLGNGQMDSILDFGFKDRAREFVNGSIDATQTYLETKNKLLSNDYTVGQFLSSHDEDGFLSVEVNGDIGKQKVAAALQITTKGQPVIYYGEELGQSGRNADMDNDIFSENRYDLAWDKVDSKDPIAMGIYNHYSKLLNFREKYSKVISKGNHTKLAGSDANKYLVYARSYQGTTAVIGLNTDEVAKTAVVKTTYAPNTTVTDEYSGTKYTVDSTGRISISIPARADGGTVILAGKDYSSSSSNEGPGSGLVSALTTATTTTTPANEQSVTNPTADQGLVKVDVKSGVTKVTLPASSAVWDGKNSLSLQSSDIGLNIPADVIAAALKLAASDKLSKSKISVSFNPLEDTEAAKQLQQAVAKNSAALKQLGESYQLSLSIVDENGTEKKLDKYSPPISVSFHVEKPSDSKLTGIYFIGANGELEYVGGEWSDKGITANVTKPGTYVVLTYDKSFSDVASSHWALDAIKQLAAQQIVNGVSNSQFAPNADVTRAEFAAILVRALGLNATGAVAFSDVPTSAWYVSAIAAASEAGIITGRADGTFGGNDQVTREEMAVMLIRAYSKVTGNEQPSGSTTPFTDLDQISSWASNAVESAVALGLLQGRESGTFDPKSPLSRAESAQVIINLFQQLQSSK